MDNNAEQAVISKVLVLDGHREHQRGINALCAQHNLKALKASPSRLMSVLRSNIDLGAILCAEDYAGSLAQTVELALTIRAARPELPVVVRRLASADFHGLPEGAERAYCAAFTLDDTSSLRAVIDEYIFSFTYPNALVRGIAQISEDVLASQFATLSIRQNTPYIVRDRVIYGEVLTLIPLASSWCRGYMMLMVEQEPVLEWLQAHRAAAVEAVNFRAVNSLFGEITNLIWGAFKNRYIGDAAAFGGSQIQVPIIINHGNRYISFGTENPQLCFVYTLTDDKTGESITLAQRFVFNLSWSPEDFREILPEAADLSDSGELELF